MARINSSMYVTREGKTLTIQISGTADEYSAELDLALHDDRGFELTESEVLDAEEILCDEFQEQQNDIDDLGPQDWEDDRDHGDYLEDFEY